MDDDDSGPVLSPTGLTKRLVCAHLTRLDATAPVHELTAPGQVHEARELIFRLGAEHEKSYLTRLKERGVSVTENAPATR